MSAAVACVRCGRRIPPVWERTEEFRASRMCAHCLSGPVPGSEPTPGRARVETWRRGEETAMVHVDERGLVTCSAELLAQLLADAGWERAS